MRSPLRDSPHPRSGGSDQWRYLSVRSCFGPIKAGIANALPCDMALTIDAPILGAEEDVMMVTPDRAFFDIYLDAWNAHDSAAVASHMADDAIYEDVALGRVLHGPSEIAAFVEEATRSSSNFRFEVVSLFAAGNDYANEWVMLGTNDRERPGAPATGRSFRVRGASIGRLNTSGRIVENRDYYNLAELLTQLGMLPAASRIT